MTHLSPLFLFDRSLPSNRTTASAGGSLSFAPGATTFGSGQTIPLLYSFCRAASADVTACDPDEADAYERAAPYWHCYLGLERYWRKRLEALQADGR